VNAGHPMANSLLLILVPLGIFLVFNLGPNSRLLPKVFLGDGGSVTLGFLVAASLVYFSQGDNALIEPVTALWLVPIPLMDMLCTMLLRHRRGYKLTEADRSHLHHALIDVGLGPRQALAVLVLGAVVCAGIGLALESVPAYMSLLCYFIVFVAHCLVMRKPEAIGGRVRAWVGLPEATKEPLEIA
jgi:UDP-GlcNAc:undecaprenyl-phosphate GlcNAc-1-phosphate transferase